MKMREHRVMPGETLASIAKYYYGSDDRRYALVIWQHNRDIIPDPNSVWTGQILVIPHLPDHVRFD